MDYCWHAYGLIIGAKLAKSYGFNAMAAIEFGVANGRGLRHLVELSEEIKKEWDFDIRLYGFDSGKGLPPVSDYRDHPEAWSEGDFPMQNLDKLQQDLKGRAKLVVGDISKTVLSFQKQLEKDAPIDFIAIDLDL